MTKQRHHRRPEEDRHLTLNGVGTLPSGEYGEIRVEGVGRITGDITCTRMCVNGSATVNGNVRAERVDIEGTCRVAGGLQAEKVKVSGWMKVQGDINAEVFHARGAFKVGGLLNADRIEVAAHGPSRVREIGGGTIVIHGEHAFPFVFGRFRRFQAWRRHHRGRLDLPAAESDGHPTRGWPAAGRGDPYRGYRRNRRTG